MQQRELKIIRAILEAGHNIDGGQIAETLLHAEVNLQVNPTATLAEFGNALAICDTRGWMTGITSKFGGRRWNISDLGEAARMEMR